MLPDAGVLQALANETMESGLRAEEAAINAAKAASVSEERAHDAVSRALHLEQVTNIAVAQGNRIPADLRQYRPPARRPPSDFGTADGTMTKAH